MNSGEALFRVERGQVDEAELAALTMVLLALLAGGRPAPGPAPAAGMRWWRTPAAYAAPDGWR
jgi:hypothetical protein